MMRNLQALSNTLLNECLLSLPRRSTDHQDCSHVPSACGCHTSDTTAGTIAIYLRLPRGPPPRRRVTSAGQSLQTNTERAARHTAGAKLCKPSCLHGLYTQEGVDKNTRDRSGSPPERGCWRCPRHTTARHSTVHTRPCATTGHGWPPSFQ